jgi:hypothetical protein
MSEKKVEDALEIGRWLGRREAFSLVAGRCSAADAKCLRELRESKKYKELGLTWEECCKQKVGTCRSVADQTHDPPASLVAVRPGQFPWPRAAIRRHGVARASSQLPFGKPSGRPWDARFVDVAQQAGLRSPVIYGSPDHNDYVLESMGCGAAFVDYDNDGWQDIVLLTGRRLDATPAGAIIRLYRNNRDGTFTDVTAKSGWDKACGPPASRWPITTTMASTTCLSPAGARTCCFTTTATAPSPTSRPRPA